MQAMSPSVGPTVVMPPAALGWPGLDCLFSVAILLFEQAICPRDGLKETPMMPRSMYLTSLCTVVPDLETLTKDE